MTHADLRIITLMERPDLVRPVASWLWETFDRHDGWSWETSRAYLAASAAPGPIPTTFVALLAGAPVATASLTAKDAPERPDLGPWLASVFVRPEARGLGLASRLVGCVEAAARQTGAPTLWLYTHSAERLYARLGWRGVDRFERGGRDARLMARDLRPDDTPP